MRKRLFAVALLALLCLGCAAKSPEEQGKRIGVGVGAAAGAGVLAAVGNPCAGVALLVQGALEATGANAALDDLRRSDPDPKFVAFMEELQRETAERRAARRLEQVPREVAPAGANAPPMGCAAQVPEDAAPNPENASPGGLAHRPASADTTEHTVAENGR